MSSQGSVVHTPSNTSDHTNFAEKVDLALFGSQVQIRQSKTMPRRASSFVKMATEDQNHLEEISHHRQARLMRSDARRGSSFIRAMSEDVGDDSSKYFGKSLSLNRDVRRGSSFLMVDDHNDENSQGRSLTSKDIRRGSSFIRTQDDSLQNEEQHLTVAPNKTPKDIRRGSSFIRTADDSIEESPRLNMRRGSSFIRMISQDINADEMHATGRLSSKPESRRGSSTISRVLSEDSSEDSISRRSSRADIRRGSSFARMISEENDVDEGGSSQSTSRNTTDRSDISDKIRKTIDNNTRSRSQRHSLESISEYKAQTFSSASLYPSVEYSSLSMESTSDFSSDFAVKSSMNNENSEENTDRTLINSSLSYLSWIESVATDTTTIPVEDNRSGEWHNFWTNYSNTTKHDYFSNPYLCPSNSGEDLYSDSNGSTQRGYTDLSLKENVVLTVEEVNEALNCTQRLMDILRGAMKRSETEVILCKNDVEEQNLQNMTKEENKNEEIETQKEKTIQKPNSSCIDVILNHTGVADILKRVINKRRDVIMPPDESSETGSKASFSDWSLSKK